MLRVHASADRRADDLAEGVVVVRHEVTYRRPADVRLEPVSIECWVTEIRAGQLHDGLRGLRRGRGDERTVYLRATTVLTPYVFATERPRRLHRRGAGRAGRLPRARRAGAPAGARRGRRRAGGGALPGPRPVLRRRRLRPRQQREVLRVLPGGADPAAWSPSGRELGAGLPPRRRADRRRLPAADPVPAEPYDCWTWVVARRQHVGRSSSPAIRDGDDGARPRAGWSASASTPRPAARPPVPEAFRRRSRRGPVAGSLEGVDHELRGVGDVVPEPARPAPASARPRRARPGSAPASARGVGRDRERRVPHPQPRVAARVGVRRRAAPVLHQEQREPLLGRARGPPRGTAAAAPRRRPRPRRTGARSCGSSPCRRSRRRRWSVTSIVPRRCTDPAGVCLLGRLGGGRRGRALLPHHPLGDRELDALVVEARLDPLAHRRARPPTAPAARS